MKQAVTIVCRKHKTSDTVLVTNGKIPLFRFKQITRSLCGDEKCLLNFYSDHVDNLLIIDNDQNVTDLFYTHSMKDLPKL